jgi:anthranilate synthase component 1
MHAPFDIAADLDTPVSAFLKLAPFHPRYLLESVEGGERVGRYSFIGMGDVFEVRLDHEGLRIGGILHPTPDSLEELLPRLRAALAAAPRPGPAAPGVPFTGGLVGATSYDFVRRIERLPARAAPRDEPEIAWMATTSLVIFDHASRRCAVLHDGPEEARVALRAQVIAALRGPIPRPTAGRGVVDAPTQTLSREAFLAAVETVQEHIRAGDVYQLVPSIGFEGHTTLDPFTVYRALRLLNPSPYMYFVDLGGTQLIGSSPEALVRLRGRTATLRPIAGTRPRGATPAEDLALEVELLADPKERAEHVMLVDLARNDLGRVASPGSVRVDPFSIIERYSHVMHIVSGVTGTLDERYDAFDLFCATFPAGTVVGAPKVRAMEIIDTLEPIQRGYYAGTVGYFGHGGDMDQAIAIRTLVISGNQYRVQSGAGIVSDSVPTSEYDEILAKSRALRAALALALEAE